MIKTSAAPGIRVIRVDLHTDRQTLADDCHAQSRLNYNREG